jgi:hypothetical protein
MGFGPLHPRPGYFVGEPDQGPRHFQPERQIFHGDVMPRNCPKCQKTLTRIRRKAWMRRFPGLKHYLCRKCGTAYLGIFGLWLVKRQRTPQK